MAPAYRMLVRILLDLAVAFCVLVAVVVLLEKHLIYLPTRHHEVTPRALGLAYQDVRLVAEDGVRLHGWFLPVAGSRFTVLLNHGNGGNVSHRLDRALLLQSRLKADVLLYDYRGYGESEGSPDEEGTYRDAQAAWAWLARERGVPPERLLVFGESLGSAVALQLAITRPARALVMESPFASIRAMARASFPWLPLAPFVRTRYDNIGKVPRLRIPLLVLHGDRDQIVPFAQGRQVFDAAPEPKRFFAIPGAGHNDTYLVGRDGFWKAISDSLDTLPPPQPTSPAAP
jgi:fermentation-respiration switch protein FrsA (DUF1100 family)